MKPCFRTITMIACATFAGIAPRLSAQDRALRDQPIPRELVEALLSPMAGRTAPSIVVGELPPMMAGKVYVPAGARVLGGMYTNTSASAVIVTSASVDSVNAWYQREQPKLGWTTFDTRQNLGSSGFGFRDAPSSPAANGMPAPPMMFCSNGTTLILQVDSYGLTDTKVHVSTTASSICAMMQQQMSSIGSVVAVRTGSAALAPLSSGYQGSNVRWPMLVNPPNSRGFGSCPQDNFSGGGTSTELSTQMSAEDLFSHYGKQLADSGWKPSGVVTTTRTWTKNDPSGNRLDFQLDIKTYDTAPRCRRLSIETRVYR